MIDLGRFEECVCKHRGVPNDLCDDHLSFEEKGKKVRLSVRSREEAKALAVDQCVCKDDQLKCDGMFLYSRGKKHWMIMVELKGKDVEHAFKQLAYMRHSRSEYSEIEQLFMAGQAGKPIHKAFIVSNFLLSAVAQHKLEKTHRIQVKAILYKEATKPVPDIRLYL